MKNKKQKSTNITYGDIIDYLMKYGNVPYSSPDKDQDQEEEDRLREVNYKGHDAVEELQKLTALCQRKFGLDEPPRILWLKGPGTKNEGGFFVQMKYSSRKDTPISISITVGMKPPTEVACRIKLELKEANADEATIKRYHSHLDLPLDQDAGLIYEVCDSETNKWRTSTESHAQLRDELKAGRVSRVKIAGYFVQTPAKFKQSILAAVERVLPYYDHAVREEGRLPEWEQSTEAAEEIKPSHEAAAELSKNLILYGPPGTGKTYHTAIYAVALCEGKPVEAVQAEDYSAVMDRYEALKKEHRIEFTTFHQSYGYEEFIEGIKPVVGEAASDLKYTIEHGVFKRFCDAARGRAEPYVFIVDEINRGNISKIFGELITLIEDTKREGMKEQASAALPYSKKNFSVPANVYLLGTMNTADRSLALMDTALRRRFQFVEMMPDADVLRTIHADKVADLDVAEMLETINKRIALLYDREHTIGHAFFTKLAGKPTIETLQGIFKNSVIPLLQEYFYEDYQKIQLVLGDNGKTDPSTKFIVDEEVRVKDVFKGNADDMADLPEIAYSINQEAFSNFESYKQIM